MSYRITTNGMLRNYQSNLYKNTRKVYDTMEKVQTGRKFNSYAENPVAASTAFRFRRAYWNAGNQIDNSNYVISKFSTGWNALDQIIDGNSDHPGLTGIEDALRALNDPIGSSRRTLGQDMLSMAKSVVMLMNVKYGDEFVFAGADGLNVPFTWGESGELYYRGVSVNAPKTLTQQQFEALAAMGRDLDATNNLPSMEAYSKFAQYYATNNAEYKDYSDWFDATSGKLQDDATFDNWEAAYDALGDFSAYVDGKVNDRLTYEEYENWYNNLGDEALTKLSPEGFKAALEDLEDGRLDAFKQSLKEEEIAKATLKDYNDWRGEEGLKAVSPEAFAVLQKNYDDLSDMKQYADGLTVEEPDDSDDTEEVGLYRIYSDWFDAANGKLPDEPALKAALDEGKLQDFAEYYTERASVTYDEYKEWYVDEFVDGGLSGIMSEEDFADLTDEDRAKITGDQEALSETLSDYGAYRNWFTANYPNYDAEDEDPMAWPRPLRAEEFQQVLDDPEYVDITGTYSEFKSDTEYAAYQTQYTDQQFEKAAIRFDEATYVDIGIGLEFDADGNVIPSSAFNSALSGLDFLGFGTDEDGDPLNIVELMRSLGELFESSDPDTGTYPEEFTYNGVTYYNSPDGEVEALANRLTNKLHDAIGRVTEQHVALDSKVSYLQKNKGQLESKRYDMNEQIETIEQEDPAVAIMEWSWARMTYQAALQIGNSILSHSLLDYMN